MKRTRHLLKSASCLAVGLVLARGAQAVVTLVGDTTITFNNAGFPNGSQIPFGYGSNASSTNAPVAGVVVGPSGLGLGTPDVSLNWQSFSTGRGGQPIQFQYYQAGPWDAAMLNNSAAGNTHELIFNVPSFASVSITSFNFQSYFNDGETFNYTISVVDANTLSPIIGSQTLNIPSTATKDLIVLNAQGGLGESLLLEITRNSGTGSAFNMAVDDVKFIEVVPEPGTTALLGLGLGTMGLCAIRRWRK